MFKQLSSHRYQAAIICVINLMLQIVALGAGTSAAPKLFGRVVDDANRPIADVKITATLMSNENIRGALIVQTVTDKDGRYSFSQALSDEQYVLEFHAAGFAYKTASALSGDGKEVITALESQPRHKLTGKVLSETGRQGIAQAQVVLIGQHVYKKMVDTSTDGSFVFDDVPQDIGQGIIYAKNGNYCSEYKIVRSNTTEVELIFKSPCQIAGIVVSETGQPIADCTIEVQTYAVSGFSEIKTTDANGKYQFDNLPSGQYRVLATAPTWFQKGNRQSRENLVNAQAGQTAFANKTMYAKIPVSGFVSGPDNKPVVGAYVATVSSSSSDDKELAQTDANGSFKLYTRTLHPSLSNGPTVQTVLASIADRYGTGTTTISISKDALAQNGLKEPVVIKLNGSMRIFGIVKDSRGNPVSNVYVYITRGLAPYDRTDASGNFNLHWFALPVKENDTYTVKFQMPRPDTGGVNMGVPLEQRKAMEIPKAGTQYYLHQEMSVTSTPSKELELKPVLTPTAILTFTGKVTDNKGNPVKLASLMLFAGNAVTAIPDEWLEKIDNYRRRPTRNGPFGVDDIIYVPLARTVTDKDGNYTICVAKETAKSFQIEHFATKIDPNLYSLGVVSLDKAYRLITDLKPEKNQNQIKVDIQLIRP